MDAVNFAIETGRNYQKKQTGFIHYCYQSEDLTTHDTIPVLENALFALSLFRSRLTDHVLEGKNLIEKLLSFEVEGNFPIYLHAYPQTSDPYLGLRILPALFWVSVDFGHVIGELKQALEKCIERIILRAHTLDPLPNWARFRLEAYEGEVGNLPSTLHDWSEGLVSLQLAERRGAEISQYLSEACKLWHPELSLYIGPAKRFNQDKDQPELTLFDLFMCQWQKKYSSRTKKLGAIHLHGALIRPLSFQPTLPTQSVPFVHIQPDGECPLFIAWEDHTFVLAKQHLKVEFEKEDLIVHLSEEGDDMGVNFFFNYHPEDEFFVNGLKANTFKEGDVVEIHSKGLTIQLSFQVEDGSYMGHFMRGNRPSQHACKGKNHFAAYDWRIPIRTIARGKSPIRVSLQIARQTPASQPQSPLHVVHCPHIASLP